MRAAGLLAAVALAVNLGSAEAQTVVANQAAIKSFLGGQGGLLVFTDNSDGGKLKLIDLDDAALKVATLDSDGCRDPRLSLDGTRVVYGVDGKLYARWLSGGDRVLIADVGTAASKGVGYWLQHDGADHIVYCSSTTKTGYASGATYKLRIKDGIDPDGGPVEIYTKAYDGGPSPDGVWIAEAYGERHAYNLETGKEYADFYKADGTKEGQCCNASMAPQSGPYRMVTLVLPHDYIRSWEYDPAQDRWAEYRTYTRPGGTVEWQRPEWSLHPDYLTAVADDDGYDLYILHAHDPARRLKVLSGDLGHSHLYVGGASSSPTPSPDASPGSPSGCTTAGDCDDSDPCTDDRCDQGTCVHLPVDDCCTADEQCDDGDPCTDDRCRQNRCVSTTISGCCTDDAQCDDGSDCTDDRCDLTSHRCVRSPVAGCCTTDDDCVDNNPCTTDTCQVATGECSNVVTGSCCVHDTDCHDGDPCSIDTCDTTTNTCRNVRSPTCGSGLFGANADAGMSHVVDFAPALYGGCSFAGRGIAMTWIAITALVGLLGLLGRRPQRRRRLRCPRERGPARS